MLFFSSFFHIFLIPIYVGLVLTYHPLLAVILKSARDSPRPPGTARDRPGQPGTARGLEIALWYIIVIDKALF